MGEARGPVIGFRPDYDLDRLRGFSDGVFAVAITLVVSTFKEPVVGTNNDNTALVDFLASQGFRYANYLAGFVLVGYYWLNHHRTFELVERANARLLTLNFFLLFFVVLSPFSTELLGAYHEFQTAFVVFNLNALLLGLSNSAIWAYATIGHRLVAPDLNRRALAIYRLRSLLSTVVFALALGAAFISTTASALSWLLLLAVRPVVTFVLGPVPTAEQDAEAAEVDEDVREQFEPVAEPDGDRSEGSGSPRGPLVPRVAPGPVAMLERLAQARSSLNRLQSFSDNVYAFAITLLVLHFELPPVHLDTEQGLDTYLSGLPSPDLAAFVISFVVIAMFWALHCKYFQTIERQDGGLRVLNLVHLMALAVLPFATELLSTFSDDQLPFMLYAAIAGLVAGSLALVYTYASVNHRLIDDDVPLEHQRQRVLLAWMVPAGFLVSILVALFNFQLAAVVWWIPLVVIRSLQTWDRHRHPETAGGT